MKLIMDYPPDDVARDNAISKAMSVIITVFSIALVMSVPIEYLFIAFGALPPYPVMLPYAIARLIVGSMFTAIGMILYKMVDWDYGEPILE